MNPSFSTRIATHFDSFERDLMTSSLSEVFASAVRSETETIRPLGEEASMVAAYPLFEMDVICDAPLAEIDCAHCDDGPFTEDEMATGRAPSGRAWVSTCKVCADRMSNPCDCCGAWVCQSIEARGQ